MCSAPRAVITTPNTQSYDRMLDMQISAMRQQQEGAAMLKQMELNQALQFQQQGLMQLRDLRVQRANDTAANAARLAALIGTPPPEKAATAPVIGAAREAAGRPKGKRGLRIERPAATQGLNIGA
ncbi:MAG: hypothetical protein VKI42_01040 [Synechococcaceae cyanobacterium]|nr:hypothetical protein [Synechococcaceae cyanobacterium]